MSLVGQTLLPKHRGVNHLQIGANRDAMRHTEGRDNLSDKAAPASPAAAL